MWQAAAQASDEMFPVHEAIKPNVEFWMKVYSVYPSTKGLIHDNRNLDVISPAAFHLSGG